ncbi:MAG: SPOR domain-containing protein [Methylococcaceae bacterium]|nr:SPOR domain-containing protein [Methylococcaceae bacterium]
MDQDLKQRLVGAVVITALAAIFVPMIFDDPIDESGKMISELTIPDQPEISNEYNSDYSSASIENVSFPETNSLKKSETNKKQAKTGMGRWFVQVGIFGEENNAISFRDKIRQQGFPVTIKSISSENGVLHRVRVGPELNKKRAEGMKQKIQKLNGLKGILIFSTE